MSQVADDVSSSPAARRIAPLARASSFVSSRYVEYGRSRAASEGLDISTNLHRGSSSRFRIRER